jgi:hypothetical protein
MRPAPKRVSGQEVEEPMLDDIIQRIDQSLPIIHKKVANGGSSETPTNRLSPVQFRKAKAVFQDMKDDPLLNEEGDDICLLSKKAKKARKRALGSKINGAHP